ncbi:hypothetical protein D3C72_1439110 [compost metagenome]
MRHRLAAGTLVGLHHFQHAVAAARSQVHGHALALRAQVTQRRQVAVRQVADVDIVAHAGAVRRRVVTAEYHQLFTAPAGHLRHIRHQVVRDTARILANQPAFMRADRIEITQVGNAPVRIRCFQVAQDLLAHQLGLAIRVGGRQREILQDRHRMGIAINRGRGTEHQLFHPGRAHCCT